MKLLQSVFSRISHIFPYSVPIRKSADQNNSECGHFSRSDKKRKNVNSGFPIITMRKVAIIYLELGFVKNFMQKF